MGVGVWGCVGCEALWKDFRKRLGLGGSLEEGGEGPRFWWCVVSEVGFGVEKGKGLW